MRALVVDDVATNRTLLRAILVKAGYEVSECADGVACLEYCNEHPLPDVILLDVMMPRLDGLATCETLRRYYSKNQLPILMVTTASEAQDVAKGLSVGANDYIAKPIDRQVLLARLENHLVISRSQRAIEEQKAAILRVFEIQRAVGDVLSSGLAVEDDEGSLIYGNKQIERMCDSRPRFVADVFQSMMSGAFHERLDEVRSRIDETQDGVFEGEFSSRAGGRTLVLRIKSSPILLPDGTVLRLWLWEDLTSTRELEEAVNQRVKLETMSLFAAGVAHNFNNVLGGILGAAELLKRGAAGNNRAERCIGVITKAVESGQRLTKRLTSMVKREVSATQGVTGALLETVRAVCDIQELLTGERITYVVNVPENLPPLAIAEQNLLDVLSNLVSNAADAIDGPGTITVAASYDPLEGSVAIKVRDTGHGMTDVERLRAFEPFFSTKNMDTRNGVSYDGNGLGLWTVYNLVQMCQGTVSLESEPGQGTTVTVTLPISPTE